jgi:hypothetical protein
MAINRLHSSSDDTVRHRRVWHIKKHAEML